MKKVFALLFFSCISIFSQITTIPGGGGGGVGSVTSVDALEGVQTVSGSAITSTGSIRGALTQRQVTITSDTISSGDRGGWIEYCNAGAIAVTLPVAGGSFPAKWYFFAKNECAGDVTITPTTSTISGAASVILSTGEWIMVVSDGTNYESATNRVVAGSGIVLVKSRTGIEIQVGNIERFIIVELFRDTEAVAVGDGAYYFPVPDEIAGWIITSVSAHVGATVSSSGAVTVDLTRCAAVATGVRCSGTTAAILSTNLTVDANEDGSETAAAAAVINTANDDLPTNGHIRFDVDAAGTSTQGLQVKITVQ